MTRFLEYDEWNHNIWMIDYCRNGVINGITKFVLALSYWYSCLIFEIIFRNPWNTEYATGTISLDGRMNPRTWLNFGTAFLAGGNSIK